MKRAILILFALCLQISGTCGLSFAKTVKVTDVAGVQMPWRGIMIDVSRSFFPIEVLYRQVDLMSLYGLNVLHLHLTDAAGWRMEIRRYPRLTAVGAWRSRREWRDWWNAPFTNEDCGGEKDDLGYIRAYSDSINGFGGYYTQEQLRKFVAYAGSRGVTVVPEIEFPGHSEEVCAAYPKLAFNHAELDLRNPWTYEFMRNVLTEVADVFPCAYIHCGGDETATQKEHYHEAMRRMNGIVRDLGRRMIVWDEALSDDPADSSMVIMNWRDPEIAKRALVLGHDVIMCPAGWCYMDSYQDCPPAQPEAMGGYRPLEHVWGVKDVLQDVLSSGGGRLLGLQSTLFTEYVPDEPSLEYQLWPRTLAIAHIASGKRGSFAEFRKWASAETDRMRRRGINAFDLRSEKGQRRPSEKLSSHIARGCRVGYGIPFSVRYSAAGYSSLTDGLGGTWNNDDGRWQGFCSDLDVTVDLGRERAVSEVSLSFLQIRGPEIYLPSTVWCNGTEMSHDNVPDAPYCIRTFTLTQRVSTRYVHIRARRIPRGGWLFVDEVVVR